MNQGEKRHFSTTGTEIRVVSDNDSQNVTLTGYAAIFDNLSENLGGFREKIAIGAFSKSIQTADIRFLINHTGMAIARTKSNTLKLVENSKGLYFKAFVDNGDPEVQALLTKIKRGDVDQMSFGFYTIADKWENVGTERIRTLTEVNLFEISAVSFPAYPQTSIGFNALASRLSPVATARQRQLYLHLKKMMF